MNDAFNYGSDQSGLIWGFHFGPGMPLRQIAASEAADWLSRQTPDGSFVWLHFNLANTATEKWLARHAVLAPEFHEALHEGSRSTRIEVVDDGLLAVVNDMAHNFSFDVSDIATVWMNVAPRALISVRRAPLKSVERVRQALERGEPVRSPVEILVHLLRDQADVLISIVRDIGVRVDKVEDTMLADRLSRRRADLGALRRVLVRLSRLLAPEPASLFRLLQRPPRWMAETDSQDLRQATEEFSVVLNDMAALQERIKLLQEEIAARIDEQTSRSLFVLTIVTVLALPINIIAGLFGMNVGGIPLASNPAGFWIVVTVVIAFTLVAGWIVVRRQNDD